MRNISDAIKEHYQAVIKYGIPEDRILGVFLYGSQNYGCALPDSDVDTKAIFIPSLEEAVLNKQMTNHEIHLANGEHCEVMDIRHLIDNFKKQNINFVEVLYTEYCYINPKYEQIWREYFIDNRERISHYDISKTVMSISGQAIHTLKQDKEDGKKIGNGKRLYYFLNHYLNGYSYGECLYPDSETLKVILDLKALAKAGYKVFGSFEADELIEKFTKMQTEFCITDFTIESKAKLDVLMNEGIMKLFKEANDNEW